jgi:hypothetical protein
MSDDEAGEPSGVYWCTDADLFLLQSNNSALKRTSTRTSLPSPTFNRASALSRRVHSEPNIVSREAKRRRCRTSAPSHTGAGTSSGLSLSQTALACLGELSKRLDDKAAKGSPSKRPPLAPKPVNATNHVFRGHHSVTDDITSRAYSKPKTSSSLRSGALPTNPIPDRILPPRPPGNFNIKRTTPSWARRADLFTAPIPNPAPATSRPPPDVFDDNLDEEFEAALNWVSLEPQSERKGAKEEVCRESEKGKGNSVSDRGRVANEPGGISCYCLSCV